MGADTSEGTGSTVIGMRVRAVRDLSGMSRHDVARASGITRRELVAVERGSRALSIKEARALAGALGVERDAFTTAETIDALAGTAAFDATRIDDVIGHDPDHWHDLPEDPADLPPALPFDLPESERRTDLDTRQRIDNSWASVRREIDEVLAACSRVTNAGSGDDMRALLKDLEATVDRLDRRTSFQKHVNRHNTKLAKVRGTRIESPMSAGAAAPTGA
ncbi:MAG: helix-turn-helix transcriptional regulator [Acidimicrobiia bacterium]